MMDIEKSQIKVGLIELLHAAVIKFISISIYVQYL
jgi:hypothetical protein